MGWWRTLLNWRGAPGLEPTPATGPEPRWARPLSFSVNVPQEMLSDGGYTAGPRVSRAQAMSVGAVKRGRDLICGTLGTLRLKLHDARRRVVPSELLEQPEVDVARSVTMTRIVEDMLFEGRAWLRITEFDGNGYPSKVVKLDYNSVNVREQARVYVSSTTGVTQGQVAVFVPDAELIRIDSPNDALLEVGARAIRIALGLDRSATRYVDGVPLGYFTPADGMDPEDEDVEEALDEWEDAVARRAWPYLGAALKANQLQYTPEQLQLAGQRDQAVLEISRLIGIDPEEVGVSTTSRTYANAEQRRLDLIDFTLGAYVTAIEDRLSMPDVTPPGYYVRAEYGGFLRSDTQSRMDTYETGRKVGVYDDERIGELEDIPTDRVRAAMKAAAPAPPPVAAPAPATPPQQEETVQSTLASAGVAFAADPPDTVGFTIGYAMAPAVAEFKANAATRTITGTVIPWNVVAYSRGYKWKFAPGSLHWAAESRVKLDRDHEYGTETGHATTLTNGGSSLAGSFKVARGAEGDRLLGLAEDGVYDGLSAYVTFESEADGWTADPDDPNVRLVHSATLRKVALTAMPAFDDARVAAVAARREDPTMTAPVAPAPPVPTPAAPAPVTAPFDPTAFAAAFTAGLTESLTAAMTAVIENLPQPQGVPPRQVVPAGRAVVTSEAPVYSMNGQGPSFVKDAWRSRTEGDHEARERLAKFERQTADLADRAMTESAQFAVNTGNASAVVPPGFRPDMYVTQLVRGRPMSNALSRGTIADASPFKIPAFVSSSSATADHVEGVNPGEGSLSVGTITVSPMAISGLYKITREIADSSNPAIDAIATQAMSESYSQQTEGKVYTKLNGADGVGGTITTGFVPSGAQASAVTEDISDGTNGKVFLGGIRSALALYPFRRFAAPDWAFLSQEGTTTFASAVDTTGRPLLPWVGAQNTVGTGNSVTQGYGVDSLTFQPAWSMSGNTSGDADAIMGNRNDAWVWESPLLTFRFEERSGPAFVELALFAYHAVEILRPVGLTGVRLTVQA